ncbi:hypothetical protein TW65_00120 [Stemphylium lycopersici]|nr:hypothetical protein TW65_00120 [Stemphylium lycopersici]
MEEEANPRHTPSSCLPMSTGSIRTMHNASGIAHFKLALTVHDSILCVCGEEIYDLIWNNSKYRNHSYDLARPPSADSEEFGMAEMRIMLPETRSHSFRSSFGSVILVMLWTAYISFNFGQRQYPRIEPQLDLGYEANGPLEVVISMYKESTEDVASLISRLHGMPQMSQALVTIYLKDGKADEELVKQETNADAVVKLLNVGREAETYLNHIVTRWDNLAERTVFLQADVHNPREFYPFFEQYFRANQTGFLNLGWAGNVCNSDDCGDKNGWQDETSLLSNIQSRIDDTARDGVLLSYKGQFVVTAARIRGIDKAIYENLWNLLVDEESWAHKEPYLHGRQDSMSRPQFGYTMERIWNVLFQCSDMDVAWKCPTLLSGWRPGGTIADCQCFDAELSLLYRELEILLELTPSTFSSPLLALPREIRDQIFNYVLPDTSRNRPELHTCLWGADMSNGEPWRHDIFGYGSSVAKASRLRPELLLINKQIREELLQNYYSRSKVTLHAELRNTPTNSDYFEFSQHILRLPMLKHVTHIRFYLEWNYTTLKNGSRDRMLKDQVRMTYNLLAAMDKIVQPLQNIETIDLSVLFFWKYRSGKMYSLSMQELFDLEGIFKHCAELRWLGLLGENDVPGKVKATTSTYLSPTFATAKGSTAGVGYKMSTERKGTEQSGGMDICVSRDLEDAMEERPISKDK